MIFGIFFLVSVIRIAVILVNPGEGNDSFHTGFYNTLVLLSYQIIIMLLTFSIALMVNRRLPGEILTRQEKFSKAFQSSPYAITLRMPSPEEIAA